MSPETLIHILRLMVRFLEILLTRRGTGRAALPPSKADLMVARMTPWAERALDYATTNEKPAKGKKAKKAKRKGGFSLFSLARTLVWGALVIGVVVYLTKKKKVA